MFNSFIIPTMNRAESLRRTLESLAALIRDAGDSEIMVVDNRSTDATPAVFKEAAERHPHLQWRYFFEPMPGLLSGRHLGAREAKGEILSFLDDDVLLGPNWLSALKSVFANREVGLAGGPSRPEFETEPPQWLKDYYLSYDGSVSCGYLSLIEWGDEPSFVNPCLIWGLNYSIRKSVFEECGGFHPDLVPKALQCYQGDGETGLSYKVGAAGYKAMQHPEIHVTHMIPKSRVTIPAFEGRQFYQGVCDSYTQIRRTRVVPPSAQSQVRRIARTLKHRLIRDRILRRPSRSGIKYLLDHAYFEGREFHRNCCRDNPEILSWVTRPDYMDYALPDDWSRRLSVA